MIQYRILLSSFPFGRITSCIMGVTGLNQDTKITELLPKIKIIVKAKGTGEGPLTSFFACCHLTPLGSFPLLFVSY